MVSFLITSAKLGYVHRLEQILEVPLHYISRRGE
jgi:hypothetical protein